MEHPRVFVINNDVIASSLAKISDIPVGHIKTRKQWHSSLIHGLIFVVNTTETPSPAEVNTATCIFEYHELVRNVLANGRAPCNCMEEVWQPASWVDCDIETEDASNRGWQDRLMGCFSRARNERRNRVSRIISLDELPKKIVLFQRFKDALSRRAARHGEQITFSTSLDRYLKHGELKKLTKEPKS